MRDLINDPWLKQVSINQVGISRLRDVEADRKSELDARDQDRTRGAAPRHAADRGEARHDVSVPSQKWYYATRLRKPRQYFLVFPAKAGPYPAIGTGLRRCGGIAVSVGVGKVGRCDASGGTVTCKANWSLCASRLAEFWRHPPPSCAMRPNRTGRSHNLLRRRSRRRNSRGQTPAWILARSGCERSRLQ